MRNLNAFLLFLIFSAFDLLAGDNAPLSCPNEMELQGKRCYKAMKLSASWPEAKEYCTIIGAKLAAIATNYEQNLISGIIFRQYGKSEQNAYWLDGSDMLVEKEWQWMGNDGSPVPFSFTYWGPKQPSNSKERCLEIRYDLQSKWNNAHCQVLRNVICEARAIGKGRDVVNDTLQEP
ncbi:hypothetical protein ACJMK2_001731 [Sinanodonta woodiana]|uniref:C-type lectin domain-containing protein n=1 Tax=Sinanodonta woodiana TaxID=1069815 RepID=A0ABD3XWB0_SINWO